MEKVQQDVQLVPLWKIFCFVLYDVSMMLSITFLTAILMPVQVIQLVGEDAKELTLGIMIGIAGTYTQ